MATKGVECAPKTKTDILKLLNKLVFNEERLIAAIHIAGIRYTHCDEQKPAIHTIAVVEKTLEEKVKNTKLADLMRVRIIETCINYGKDTGTALKVAEKMSNEDVKKAISEKIKLGERIYRDEFFPAIDPNYPTKKSTDLAANLSAYDMQSNLTKEEIETCCSEEEQEKIIASIGKLKTLVLMSSNELTTDSAISSTRRIITALIGLSCIQRENGKTEMADKTLRVLSKSLNKFEINQMLAKFKSGKATGELSDFIDKIIELYKKKE